MRRAQGYGVTKEPGKADIEQDSFTCVHCNFVSFVKPFQDPSEMGGFCCQCGSHICAKCADLGECRPFEKWLDMMESRNRLTRSILG